MVCLSIGGASLSAPVAQAKLKPRALSSASYDCNALGNPAGGSPAWYLQNTENNASSAATQGWLVRAQLSYNCNNLRQALDDMDDRLSGLVTLMIALNSNVDGLEGFTNDIEPKLDTLGGYVDGLETAQAATNTKLDTLASKLDAVVAAIDAKPTPGADDATASFVRYSSGETTVADAAAYEHADVWWLIGLMCALFFGFLLYRAVSPRG